MPLVDSPWVRIKNPLPIPDPCRGEDLAALDDVRFAELLRSQLVPRDQSPAGRKSWDQFWSLLREDPQLADRTYDVLDEFLDTTEDAINGGQLPPSERERAEKFRLQCQQSWNRIDRGRERTALAWAGAAGQFSPGARRVIATLIGAIARHRATVLHREGKPSPADAELWDTMRALDLDPRDHSG